MQTEHNLPQSFTILCHLTVLIILILLIVLVIGTGLEIAGEVHGSSLASALYAELYRDIVAEHHAYKENRNRW